MIASTDLCDLLDCRQSFSKDLRISNDEYLQLRRDEFRVIKPYYRVGQKRKRDEDNDEVDAPGQRNKADIETEQRHRELRSFLMQCLDQIPKPFQFSKEDTVDVEDNDDGKDKPDQDQEAIDFVSLSDMARIQSHFAMSQEHYLAEATTRTATTTEEDVNMDVLDVFNSWIRNPSDICKLLTLEKMHTFLIPPRSQFYMSDMATSMTQLVAEAERVGGFDFVVMDPPWPNKSVHRSGRYETQDIYDLFQIPMPKIMSCSCLVAIWVTNKPKFRRFITQKLFKKWKIKEIGTWLWIKVTTEGEPVIPLDSPHRKPYEQLVIGYHQDDDDDAVGQCPDIPEQRAIVSVPCRRHSRKPPLQGKYDFFLNLDSRINV